MRVLFLLFYVFAQTAFSQGAHSTNFKPERDGFHFANTFANTIYDQRGLKLTVSGCSGGMVYAALDYYNLKMITPKQSYPPPDQSLLFDYIVNRENYSISDNEEQWLEMTANSFGWQDHEFFNWGLQGTNGGRLKELKTNIDRGLPVPIGLFATADGRLKPDNQVLAIGYDYGRYQGDLGDYMEDVKIYCYNPEYPDIISTLQVNKTLHYFFWTDHESNGDHYAGYFVDARYVPGSPPPDPSSAATLPDCRARELVITFKTGEDGLRGGDDNCNIILQFRDGTVQQFLNVNRKLPWLSNSTQTVELWLANPLPLNAFKNIIVYTRPCDGLNGITCTNWKLNQLTISARGGFPDVTILNQLGNPLLKRFSGKDYNSSYEYTSLPLCDTSTTAEPKSNVGTTNRLLVRIITGNDDLQGGNSNLSMTIGFRDGSTRTIANVNAGMNWPISSSNRVTLDLNKDVSPADIMSIELQTNKCQESSCDNWNFQGITVIAKGNNKDELLYQQSGNPIYRFTGNHNVYTLILRKN